MNAVPVTAVPNVESLVAGMVGCPTGMTGSEGQNLAELYKRFGPGVHRRAVSITRDEQEALDVTQETFLAYMRAMPKLRGDAAPFTVLYSIATNLALDRVRRRARWSGILGSLSGPGDDDEDPVAAVPSPDAGGVPRTEAAMDLALLTQGEKPDAVTAAFLYFVEGYTTDEIGRSLDLSRKTVGRLLVRFAERAKKRSARLEPGVNR
jgi:RNA polymerase sigma factor (sigma-70 family)